MSTTTITTSSSQSSSISQHLREIKRILQDGTCFAKIAMTLDNFEFDVLEQDVSEILRLIRSWRNTVSPINRIPPEILVLIPDFWYTDEKDEDLIALTHVCRAWREVFTSRPSLWTHLDLDSMNEDKAHVYLERSKSSSIALSLSREDSLMLPFDPVFQIIPQIIGRLGYLHLRGTPENIQDIIAHLSRPAPLLKDLTIFAYPQSTPFQLPVLTSTLFDGDLSSLRKLYLNSVRTELPWRNMANLTTFSLRHTPPGEITVRHLLDFFESAPHLREVNLYVTTPTSGAQNGRLVPLAYLKRMEITSDGPYSVLLDHLLIPVCAELVLEVDFLSSPADDLPRSLDNLRNLSNFTTIKLHVDELCPYMTFSGPNGRVSIIPTPTLFNETSLLLGLLDRLDTSRTERFRIENDKYLYRDLVYCVLLPLKELRALMVYECNGPNVFFNALHPSTSSPDAVVCPKLEELVLVLCENGKVFDMGVLIGMAEVRASGGKRLKTVRIVDGGDELNPEGVLELGKHVGRVECTPRAVGVGDEWWW